MTLKSPKFWLTVLLLAGALWMIADIGRSMSSMATEPADADRPFAILPADQRVQLPDFAMKTPDGAPFSLADAVAKGPVVLDFWATYCGPCRLELPELDKIRQQYESKGVQFYAVNSNDEPSVVQQYAAEMKLGLPMLIDQPPIVSAALEINAIPVTIIIGRNRTIVAKLVGYDQNMKEDLPLALDKVVADNL
ncbi:MAG TPA: TlpA disulfide reductase family protein [Capsulimonadaceae bacterium]|jgi:thiol-disulfide isomerase/thioredoxin